MILELNNYKKKKSTKFTTFCFVHKLGTVYLKDFN